MRRLFAMLICLAILAIALGPHAHAAHASEHKVCAACALGQACDAVEPPPALIPDLCPAGTVAGLSVGRRLVGAPLGLHRGQSPPARA